MRIERLNGTIFEDMIKGGYNNLCNHEKEINDMNVFPVPDGDTGYNMRMTLENGIKNAPSDKHLGNYLKSLSNGMLLGARGNSGVILSQLFYGMSVELERKGIVDAGELRDAFTRAYKTAYSAVAHPVEGTILTIAREGIENIRSQIRRGITADMVVSMYLAEMRKSVRHTPEMLNVLKEAGVLDSGAVGYITIMDGMARAMYGESIKLKSGENTASYQPSENVNHFDSKSKFEFGYCTEFLLQLLDAKKPPYSFDLDRFRNKLLKMGDSLVVIRSDTIVKVHIHTFEPEKVIAFARQWGEFISFKLENMQLQHTEFENRKKDANNASAEEDLYSIKEVEHKEHKPLGIIAVADGEGITEILKGLGADIVLAGGQTMNTPAEAFVEAYSSIDADRIVVLPNNANILQASLQAVQISGLADKVVVIPTKSVLEGYYALALGSMDIEDVDERTNAMKDGAESVATVSVAKAVKDYTGNGFSCQKGDYLGFVGKKIISAQKQMHTALIGALKSIEDLQDKSAFILLTGAKVCDDDKNALRDLLEAEFADMELDFLYGGQNVYDVIVGVV